MDCAGSIDPSAFLASGSVIAGQVHLGADCSIWHNAVLRADIEPITVGAGSNIQDNTVVHVDHGFPATIGQGVTVGHGAIIHGCAVGDNTVVGMGAIVLNGARIGRDCIIGAGALVTQGTVVPDGHMAFGSPAKIIRPLTPDEIERNRENAAFYVRLARRNRAGARA